MYSEFLPMVASFFLTNISETLLILKHPILHSNPGTIYVMISEEDITVQTFVYIICDVQIIFCYPLIQ